MNNRQAGAVLVGVMLSILIPSVASAHVFTHQPGCAGLTWAATIYNAQETNTIVVTVDGTAVHTDPNFGTTDTGNHPWNQTVDHTWSIVINAPGTLFDHNVSGVQQACQPTTTVSTPATTTIPEETTTSTSTAPTTSLSPSTSVSVTTDPTPTSTSPTTASTEPSTTTSTVVSPTNTADPSTSSPPSSPGSLPATGSDSNTPILAVAGVMLMLGTVAVRVARRA